MSAFSQHIQERVRQFITSQQLLSSSPHTLYVALSGGPDSVALLHLLCQLQFVGKPRVAALHCNFHLRGAESDRDQLFCQQLCSRLKVELQVREFDTLAYMNQKHLSLEMAARELRYQWWASITDADPNCLIALGHHEDDSVETFLMNLMRGTGIAGLTGIVASHQARQVIRPLLCLSREEILRYLHDNQLNYVTDSTNLEDDTLRNQIRHQLLPLMTQLLPHARQGIVSTMQHLQQTACLSREYISAYFSAHAEHHVVDGFSYYLFRSPIPYPYQMGQYLRKLGLTLDGQTAYPAGETLPLRPMHREELSETFDSDRILYPLRWRRWQEGDRMAPLGMNGHTKLLSDLFSNAHYLPLQKRLAWVLEDAGGQILWVPGLRMCHGARITDATRHKVTICYGDDFEKQ